MGTDLSQQRAECLLALTRKPVGVKLFFSEEAFENCSFAVPRSKLPYCVAVRMAGEGFAWKIGLEQTGCMGGARALGMVPLDAGYRTGEVFMERAVYCGIEVAKQVAESMTLVQRRAVGFAAAPLEQWEHGQSTEAQKMVPDIVLLICDPYTAMRIVQGYTYQFGTNTAYRLSGNQAICSECTAYPFERGKLNLSMLCSGTRIKAGWKDNELALGIPYTQLDKLLDGVEATVNPMDNDAHKHRIAEGLKETNTCRLKPEDIQYHHNYFTGFFQTDRKRFFKGEQRG